jgi:hypothetical protein
MRLKLSTLGENAIRRIQQFYIVGSSLNMLKNIRRTRRIKLSTLGECAELI